MFQWEHYRSQVWALYRLKFELRPCFSSGGIRRVSSLISLIILSAIQTCMSQCVTEYFSNVLTMISLWSHPTFITVSFTVMYGWLNNQRIETGDSSITPSSVENAGCQENLPILFKQPYMHQWIAFPFTTVRIMIIDDVLLKRIMI